MRLPGLPQSLLFRLILPFSLIALVSLIILGMAITRAIELHFVDQDVEVLHHRIRMLEQDLREIRADGELRPQFERIVGKHHLSVIVLEPEGGLWFVSKDMAPPGDISVLTGADALALHWKSATGSYRGLRSAWRSGHPDLPEGDLIVAMEISYHDEFLTYFRLRLWTFIAAAILGICLFGWIAVRIVLTPLRRIIAGASDVSADKLSLRLPVEAVPHELKELAHSLNIMLARLELSFKRLSDFSSDIAHELRTPLSNMKIQTQVALFNRRDVDEYKNVLQSNVEELDQLGRMVNNMLFLAKAENGLEAPDDERVDLTVEVKSLFDFYEALAESREIGMELEGEATLRGDREMLRRALSNLLTNAITHSVAGSVVRVVLEPLEAGCVRVTVSSRGETIAPEHLPRLFDRFYRIDSARRRATEGAGLGLSITRSIIEAHGGSIAAYSENGMTRFVVVLPGIVPPLSRERMTGLEAGNASNRRP